MLDEETDRMAPFDSTISASKGNKKVLPCMYGITLLITLKPPSTYSSHKIPTAWFLDVNTTY